MKNKRIHLMLLSSLLITSCSINTSNTNNPSLENEVKIKKISAYDNQADNAQILNRKESNRSQDELNYIIIYKSQIDIQFTITLDNPEAYGIDALRVKCDDEDAQIQVDGEWKPIAFEDDGTRVVNWSSEDPYEKTYNIRTTSDDAMNIFEVIDIRLSGHEKFQSKETENTDIGNNELQIHKMDEDAYSVDIIENTFEYIKFKLDVKDSYSEVITDILIEGKVPDSNNIYTLYEDEEVEIKYCYKLNSNSKVDRCDRYNIQLLSAKYFNTEMVTAFDYYHYYDSALRPNDWSIDNITGNINATEYQFFIVMDNKDLNEETMKLYYNDIELEIISYENFVFKLDGNPFNFKKDPLNIRKYICDDMGKHLNSFKLVLYGNEYRFKYNVALDLTNLEIPEYEEISVTDLYSAGHTDLYAVTGIERI